MSPWVCTADAALPKAAYVFSSCQYHSTAFFQMQTYFRNKCSIFVLTEHLFDGNMHSEQMFVCINGEVNSMQNTSMIHTDYSFLSTPVDVARRQLTSCTVSRDQSISTHTGKSQQKVNSVSIGVSHHRTSGSRRAANRAGRELLKKSILAVCMLLTVFALLMITSGTTSAGEEQEARTKFYTSYDIQ